MPVYEYNCVCGKSLEKFQPIDSPNQWICPECSRVMPRGAGSIAVLKMDGMFPSRKEWMDNWTPDSPKFSTGSLHGARY